VERAPAVCIFGRGVRDWKGPAVCIFGRPFPQKRERCAARSPQPSLCETGSRVGSVECEIGLCVAKGKRDGNAISCRKIRGISMAIC